MTQPRIVASVDTRILKLLIRPAASRDDRPELHFSDLISANVAARLKSIVVIHEKGRNSCKRGIDFARRDMALVAPAQK